MDYLRKLKRKLDAGELADDAAADKWEADQSRHAAEQRRKFNEIQTAKLSKRHVADARRISSGEVERSAIWTRLSNTLRDTPDASVLLCGNTGAGKTTAATGYALSRISRGLTVLVVAGSRCASIAKYDEAREEAERADLLLLDEMHRLPSMPEWIRTPMIGLIDSRYENRRQVVAMATVGVKTVEDALGIEVVERFDAVLGTDEDSYRRKG
jgi:DNA replication protein DnaC